MTSSKSYIFAGITLLLLHIQRASAVEDLVSGERLYVLHCAGCHGPKGEGGRGPRLAVSKLSQAIDEKSLTAVIRLGIPGTEMQGARLDNDEIRQVSGWVRKLGKGASPQILGNVGRGEQLYRTKGNCAQCHTIKTEGGVLGPDLTDIGSRRGPAYLRNALVDPEAEVPENFSQYRWVTYIPDNFLQVRVVTSGGERITGIRLNEDPFSIQIRDLSGRVRSFFKSELLSLHKDWGKSVMPSYRDVFSKDELDDIVAFLAWLRGVK